MKNHFGSRTRVTLNLLTLSLVLVVIGCQPNGGGGAGGGGNSGERKFRSIGSAPVGGVFFTVGGALSDILNENKGDNSWQFSNESTGGSMENIRRITDGDIDVAMSNSSITYFAARGEGGFDQKYDVQAVMTLFPNVAMFVTKKDSGVKVMADLKGKRVSVGPEGAGFEYFVRPLLEAHGIDYDGEDIEKVFGGQQTCVNYLGDGQIDAAFLGGGVPTASITSAASTMDIFLIPYGDEEKKKLIDQYKFFEPATVPANTYRGVEGDYHGLNVGSAHLIVSSSADEDFVYQITKIIYENRDKVAEKHKAGKAINPKNVVRNTGTEFHPGAIKFYKEAGIWPESEEPAGEKKSDADSKPEATEEKTGDEKSEAKEAEPKPEPAKEK